MRYQPRHAKPSRAKQRAYSLAAAGAATTALVVSPAVAGAQTTHSSVPGIDTSGIEQGVWDARNNINGQARQFLPGPAATAVQQGVDGAVNAVFPGLIADREAAAAAAAAPAPAPAAQANTGACPPSADACVDIAGGRSWLQDNGRITYGPVPSSAGAETPATATPRGTMYVQYKVKDEVSREFNNAPMPYAVYFTNTGVAFHAGTVGLLSHGCIHLNYNDAVVFFNSLQPGDEVFVY